jgi:hypothetical protein
MSQDDKIESFEDTYATQLAQRIRMAQNNMPATKDWIDLNAELAQLKYRALKAKGFTDDQALTLITHGVI